MPANVAVDTLSTFNKAEQLLQLSRNEEAFELYSQLRLGTNVAPLAYFRMGEILNRQGNVENSLNCHRKALELDPHLMRGITASDHTSHNYKYDFVEQTNITHCPICGTEGRKHSCYNDATDPIFTPGFDPIRLWMYCGSCPHIFAANYPIDFGSVLRDTSHDFYLKPRPEFFPVLGNILSALQRVAPGRRLLEVGVGGGEMSAVAKELLFDVTGIDIRPQYAKAVAKMLEIPVHIIDFLDFETVEPFDVVCIGDVIEHVTDPIRMLRKAVSMLRAGGVLWLSTPNFESAFSRVVKDNDPMWRVCEHLNYFCYRSLEHILESLGMSVVSYVISSHYNGSMEVTSVKQS